MNIDPQYAKEYGAMIKERSEPELMAARQELLTRLKMEQATNKDKDNPALQNINWQLTLIGRELHSRKPANKQDRMQAAEGKNVETKARTFEEAIKEKTLDELVKILELAKKELGELKRYIASAKLLPDALKQANGRIDMLTRQISILESEIQSRSPKAAEDAKNDFDKASGRSKKIFGIESDYIIWGAVGGVVGGIIAYNMKKKKSVAGFAILGIGLASGIIWLAKGGLSPQAKSAPNV